MEVLDDEVLASAAYVLRIRAANGDRGALREAERIERILKARLGPTPSGHVPLDITRSERKPWWRFW
ncbi:hypothetical protein [Variovorax sp. LT1R16]|uniref:hypothetical protein n=1 Tax=Variovorax sp. LT1R16 TaxID=3443728 RepID=UPI003F492525